MRGNAVPEGVAADEPVPPRRQAQAPGEDDGRLAANDLASLLPSTWTRLFPAATTHRQSSRVSRRQRIRRRRRRPPRNPPLRLALTTAPRSADRSENAPGGKYAFAAPFIHHVVVGRRRGVVVVVVL